MRAHFLRHVMAMSMASALLVAAFEPAAARDHGRAGAAIGGLIVGTAIAAAVSPRKKVVEKIYVPVGAPPPAEPYSPAAGVVCYPAQRACYTNGGGYDPRWTWQVYAR